MRTATCTGGSVAMDGSLQLKSSIRYNTLVNQSWLQTLTHRRLWQKTNSSFLPSDHWSVRCRSLRLTHFHPIWSSIFQPQQVQPHQTLDDQQGERELCCVQSACALDMYKQTRQQSERGALDRYLTLGWPWRDRCPTCPLKCREHSSLCSHLAAPHDLFP